MIPPNMLFGLSWTHLALQHLSDHCELLLLVLDHLQAILQCYIKQCRTAIVLQMHQTTIEVTSRSHRELDNDVGSHAHTYLANPVEVVFQHVDLALAVVNTLSWRSLQVTCSLAV